MENRLTTRALLWPASFAFVACGASTLLIAWEEIYRTVVLAITILLWGVVVILLIALAVLVFSWTGWRIQTTRADMTLNERAVQMADELTSPVKPASSGREANLWIRAYATLGQLGWLCGTLSFEKMRPYFSANAERYWRHMVGAMKEAGYAQVVTAYTPGGRPYKVTVFVGPYRKFFVALMRGGLILPPHPKLPPPVISTFPGLVETTAGTEMMETTA